MLGNMSAGLSHDRQSGEMINSLDGTLAPDALTLFRRFRRALHPYITVIGVGIVLGNRRTPARVSQRGLLVVTERRRLRVSNTLGMF